MKKNRVNKGKDKIQTWSKMGKRLHQKFLPLDYAQTLFCRFQNLKQNLSTVEEFTHEFYQLSIRVDHKETDEQLTARYVNCLKFTIQNELSMHRVHNVEEAYQLALKAEEKKNCQFSQRNRGARRGISAPSWGGSNIGRGESSHATMKVEYP